MTFIMMSIVKNNMLYLVYEYDNQLFENLFCRNVDTPELECHGQCILTDLHHEQDEDNTLAHLIKQLQIEIVYVHDVYQMHISQATVVENLDNQHGFYSHTYSFTYSDQELEPPQQLIVLS